MLVWGRWRRRAERGCTANRGLMPPENVGGNLNDGLCNTDCSMEPSSTVDRGWLGAHDGHGAIAAVPTTFYCVALRVITSGRGCDWCQGSQLQFPDPVRMQKPVGEMRKRIYDN